MVHTKEAVLMLDTPSESGESCVLGSTILRSQIVRIQFCSKMPFIHLLPLSVYNKILFIFGENDSCIKELLNIKAAGLSIEHFESIIKESNGRIVDRILWFINPHYKQKFKLKPRKLMPILSSIRYIRNYFSTSCFYITK